MLDIYIDSREKRNEKIIEAFEKRGIFYKIKKLDFGDYSGLVRFSNGKRISLETVVFYERKRELTELSNTLCQGERRFINELELANTFVDHKKLIIEDIDYYRNILNHNYRTKLPPDVFLKKLYYYQNKYKFEIVALDGELTASYIYRNMIQVVEDKKDFLLNFAR